MNNSIKPTRLWHLTGKKHFQSILRDKRTSVPPLEQRSQIEILKLMGIVFASAAGILYTYGTYSPPVDRSIIVRSPDPCLGQRDKDVKPVKIDPCPEVNPRRPRPCP